MTVKEEDVARLTSELQARFGLEVEDDVYDLTKWTAMAGIESDALGKLIGAAVMAVRGQMREAIQGIATAAMENEGEMDADNPMLFSVGTGMVDLGEMIANSCYHCFVLGWEIRDQYGKATQ